MQIWCRFFFPDRIAEIPWPLGTCTGKLLAVTAGRWKGSAATPVKMPCSWQCSTKLCVSHFAGWHLWDQIISFNGLNLVKELLVPDLYNRGYKAAYGAQKQEENSNAMYTYLGVVLREIYSQVNTHRLRSCVLQASVQFWKVFVGYLRFQNSIDCKKKKKRFFTKCLSANNMQALSCGRTTVLHLSVLKWKINKVHCLQKFWNSKGKQRIGNKSYAMLNKRVQPYLGNLDVL